MQIRSMSWRYASYWNAFLFLNVFTEISEFSEKMFVITVLLYLEKIPIRGGIHPLESGGEYQTDAAILFAHITTKSLHIRIYLMHM